MRPQVSAVRELVSGNESFRGPESLHSGEFNPLLPGRNCPPVRN